MFKRFTCFVLSLVLLLALLPAGAVKAEAASYSTSAKAITILKKVEKFDPDCDPHTGKIGYGTKCTETGSHGIGKHTIREDEAAAALKEELKTLDSALNSFASSNGISLSQNQHDAMVLFTFRNGKAWMNGSDDLRTAVVQGMKGNEFLNRMLKWNGTTDVEYRKILANMYLNNKYDSSAPANFVLVSYDAKGGELNNGKEKFDYFYDRNLGESALMIPERPGYRFAGWMTDQNDRTTLMTGIPKNDDTLYATWQKNDVDKKWGTTLGINLDSSKFLRKYSYLEVGGKEEKNVVGGTVWATNWYVDGNGIEWVRIDGAEKWNDETNKNLGGKERWMKWRGIKPGAAKADTSSGSSDDLVTADRVKVTVTNDYINVREKPSIFATQVGTVYRGDVLRITSTKEDGGYLWGRYVDASYQEVGYVALMYTNYNDLMNGNYGSSSSSGSETKVETVVAKAVIDAKAYVNVRDGAGTSHNIVSSLRNGTQVDLYEIKYVNGQEWGRCSAGWFSLAYADVTVNHLESVNTSADIGFMSYVFKAKIMDLDQIFQNHDGQAKVDFVKINEDREKNKKDPYKDGDTFTISNITAVGGETWGRIAAVNGWVLLTSGTTSSTNVVWAEEIKYTTIAQTSVREYPNNGAGRLTTLSAGTEFDIEIIVADGDTIWGYADDFRKHIANTDTNQNDVTYSGWVNLSTKYVSRNGVKVETPKTESDAGKIYTLGTIINAPEVNVRSAANIWGTLVGKLANGTTVVIKDGPVNGTRKTGWYQLDVTNDRGTESWVRGDYLDIHTGTMDEVTGYKEPTSPDGTQAATGRGMVANTYRGVAVRVAPGTANALVTRLLPGTEVTIYDVVYHGSTQWGQIEQGWVCMDYIAMMDYDDLPGTSTEATVVEKAIYTGRAMVRDSSKTTDLQNRGAIDSTGRIIVYATANRTDNNIVRYLDSGDDVTIHELLTSTEVEDRNVIDDDDMGSATMTVTSYWARINDGYILLPQYTVYLDALDESVYTVTDTDLLKVRKNAGASSERHDFDLKKYDQVKVTNLEIVQASVWGQIEHNEVDPAERAWISLAYCTKGSITEPVVEEGAGEGGTNDNPAAQPMPMSPGNTGTGTTYAGTIVGSAQVQEVNVRKDATTNSAEVTTLKKGTAITITETKLVDGRSWGYCGSGWINLLYVDLTPVGITAIDAKIIAVDNTLCYESYETGAKVVGSYANRAVVHIYSEMNGMYETDMGWVAKGNFLN